MTKERPSVSIKQLLLKALHRSTVFLSLSLIVSAIILIFINYFAISITQNDYRLIQSINQLHDDIDENNVLFLLWIDSSSDEAHERIKKLTRETIPKEIQRIESLTDHANLQAVKTKFRKLSWTEWVIMDVASSEGNEPAERNFETIIFPLYMKISANLLNANFAKGSEQQNEAYHLYSAISKIESVVPLFLKNNDQVSFNKIRENIERAQMVMNNAKATSEIQRSTFVLIGKYISQIKKLIRIRQSENWGVINYQVRKVYYPLYHSLLAEVDLLRDAAKARISAKSDQLIFLCVLLIFVIVVTLILLILYQVKLLKRLSTDVISPIESLIDNMKKIASGIKRIYIPKQRLLEFNHLIHAFEMMNKTKNESEGKLAYMAYHDPVTGFGNQALFEKNLSADIKQLHRNEQISLCYLSISNLHTIRNTWGSDIRDKMTKIFIKRISDFTPSINMIYRYNTTDFVFYMKTEEHFALENYLKSLVAVLIQIIHYEHVDTHIQFMMGAAVCNSSAQSYNELLNEASFATLHADHNVRFKIFDKPAKRSLLREKEIEKEMQEAMHSHMITVEFQPQVKIRDKKLIGFEALARWNHPKLGKISPIEFIRIAEASGQIIDLDRYIQDTALKHFSKWIGLCQYPIKLAINASLAELIYEPYYANLIKALDHYQIPYSQIEIEITESLFMTHSTPFTNLLKKLRENHITISMDDFGSGYSSLERIQYIDFDLIKIDKAFTLKLGVNPKSQAILASIIQLANHLQLPTLAEGVENEVQHQILKELGCDYGQGCYYQRPLEIHQVAPFIHKHC